MAFSDFVRQSAPGLAGLLGGSAGFYFGGPAGAGLGQQLGQLGGGLLANLIPESETPFQKEAREAQMGLLQQLKQQTPFQAVDFNPIRQQELSRFQQQTIPQLAERFAGKAGGIQSSAFQRSLGEAGTGLGERLAALQAQHEVGQQGAQRAAQGLDLSRLGQLQGFLQGDRLAAQQQNAAQQAQIGSLLNLGSQAAQGAYGRQQDIGQQLRQGYAGAANIGLGKQFEPLYSPAQPGLFNQQEGLKLFTQLAKLYAGGA